MRYLEILQLVYEGVHPKILAGNLNDVRISAPQWFIDHANDEFSLMTGCYKNVSTSTFCGIQIIPCLENKITIFHLNAPVFTNDKELYFSVNLNEL